MSCIFYCKEDRCQLEQPGVVGSVKEDKRQVEHVRLLKRLRAVSAVGGSGESRQVELSGGLVIKARRSPVGAGCGGERTDEQIRSGRTACLGLIKP